ncbi:uncharacterized protein LOC119076366 [Bradysia coprophila]|uniref:uncharacterized protein LOC119076366 n=1 Tax=Bradysia coprophila TaxID=38358 RepID=UPI00187DA898|nr:uncharacterized protein LOC119076366 [Bradysia coprophila]
MSRRITRSQTVSVEQAPVYRFLINRKSSSTRKSCQPLTPITNNRISPNKSASKEQCSEQKKTKRVQVVPNPTSPLKKKSAAAERKTLSNVKRNSSSIDLKLNRNAVEQTTAITLTSSRIMTRSLSVLLAKAPVNIGRRKSEPANIFNQHLANQITSKNVTTNAPITPSISIETSTASKKLQTATKVKTLLNNITTSTTAITWNTSRRMTRSQSVLLAKAPVNIGGRKSEPAKILNQNLANQLISKKSATKALTTPPNLPERCSAPKKSQTAAKAKTNDLSETAKIDDNVNVFATDSRADETQPMLSTSIKAACGTPRRKAKSQSGSLAKAPVNLERRKSESAKKRNQNLVKSCFGITTKVVTTPPTSPTVATEVTIETGNASNKSKSASKAKSLSKNEPVIETIPVEGKCVLTTRLDDNGNPAENDSQPEEADPVAPSLNLQLISDTTAATVSPTSSIRLRRSTRSSKGLIPKRHEDVTRKNDSPSAARPFIVSRRRHTVNSFQSTTDAVVANASVDDQGTSNENITTDVQSDIIKRPMNTKPALRKDRSTTDINANSTTDENVSIVSTENQGKSTNRASTKPASAKKIPASTKIKNKENEAAFIKIPDGLRQILVDDSKFINTSKRLYEIPSDFNVAELVDEYVMSVVENEASNPWNSTPMSCGVIFEGIIEYFDTLIGRQLLYEPERDQYTLIMNNYPGVAMSKIYPPIYLLRLLVQLNKLLHYKDASKETMKFSMDHLHKFINYLTDNKSTFFNTS